MPPKPKTAKQSKEDLLKPLEKSDVLRRVILLLEDMSPTYKGLPAAATIEQRAMLQVEIQTYQNLLLNVKGWFNGVKNSEIESTYGADQTK